jgi:two-component sensor histidine kinase
MTKLLGLRRPGLAILALALFTLTALIAWRATALIAERAQRLAGAQTSTGAAAVYVGNYIARTVDAADLIADDIRTYVTASGGLGRMDPALLQQRLAAKVAGTSVDDNILVVDAQGRTVAVSEEGGSARRAVFTDRAWFQAHVNGAEDYLGPAVKSRVTDKVVYTYSEALRGAGGALEGIVAVGIAPTQPKPPEARAEGEPLAQLWTSDKRLIVASHMEFDAAGNPRPQQPPFAAVPPGPMGFLPVADRIAAFHKPEGHSLIATVTAQRSGVLAPWRNSVRDSAVLLGVAGLITALLAVTASRFANQDYRARLALEQSAGALSAAVAEKDLLLREIHHRVKNNLQITSSLIQLQSRKFADPNVRAAFDQTQQRLRSISLVHDVLYHENTSARVDMGVYLKELSEEIANGHGAAERGVSLTVDAEPVALSPGQVTPLGLVLAEVLTNAFKHAFPDGPGAITVTAREVERRIEVTVRDNGRGYDGAKGRDGSLGLMLISVLSRQLGGTSTFEKDGGTLFRLVFPRKG